MSVPIKSESDSAQHRQVCKVQFCNRFRLPNNYGYCARHRSKRTGRGDATQNTVGVEGFSVDSHRSLLYQQVMGRLRKVFPEGSLPHPELLHQVAGDVNIAALFSETDLLHFFRHKKGQKRARSSGPEQLSHVRCEQSFPNFCVDTRRNIITHLTAFCTAPHKLEKAILCIKTFTKIMDRRYPLPLSIFTEMFELFLHCGTPNLLTNFLRHVLQFDIFDAGYRTLVSVETLNALCRISVDGEAVSSAQNFSQKEHDPFLLNACGMVMFNRFCHMQASTRAYDQSEIDLQRRETYNILMRAVQADPCVNLPSCLPGLVSLCGGDRKKTLALIDAVTKKKDGLSHSSVYEWIVAIFARYIGANHRTTRKHAKTLLRMNPSSILALGILKSSMTTEQWGTICLVALMNFNPRQTVPPTVISGINRYILDKKQSLSKHDWEQFRILFKQTYGWLQVYFSNTVGVGEMFESLRL